MSYILDALKKSDQERAVSNIQTLDTTDSTQPTQGRKLVVVLLSVVIVLILVLVAVVWGLRDRLTPLIDQSDAVLESTPPVVIDSTRVVKEPDPEVPNNPDSEPGDGDTDSGSVMITDSAPATPNNSVVSLANLDAALRSGLPSFSVDVLSFSANESRRFVMINQQIYKEGDLMADDLVITAIEQDRVVLTIKGQRFYILP